MDRNLLLAPLMLLAVSGCDDRNRALDRQDVLNEACRDGDMDACRAAWSNSSIAQSTPSRTTPSDTRQYALNEACRVGDMDACRLAWSDQPISQPPAVSPPLQTAAAATALQTPAARLAPPPQIADPAMPFRPPPFLAPLPTPSFVATGGAYRGRIDGEFKGWEGETIYKLLDGRVLQQSQYHYHYHYAYSPDILIYSDKFGTLKAHVFEDSDQDVNVRFLN